MKFKYFLIIALLLRLFLAPWVSHIDVSNHLDWGERFFEYTPSGFYAPEANTWDYTWPNQPPGTMYIFAGSYLIFKFVFSVLWFLNTSFAIFPSMLVTFADKYLYVLLVKLPAILSDLGIAWIIYEYLKKNKRLALIASYIYLANPVVIYNSAVWGQTDATVNFFVLLSFLLLFRKKLVLSVIFFALSLYIKISLAIFAPAYLVFFMKKYGFKKIIKPAFIALSLIILFTLPFSSDSGQNPLSFLYYIYTQKVLTEQMQVITANALNFWGFATGLDLKSHFDMFGPLSYQNWGYLLAVLALLPIYFNLLKKVTKEKIIWVLMLTSLSIFMLFTNMHERYVFPAIVYFSIIAVKNKKLFYSYIALSLITLVNMYNLWWVPEIGLIKSMFENMWLLRLISFANFSLFVFIYIQSFTKTRSNLKTRI